MPFDLSSQIGIHHMDRERVLGRGTSYAKAHGNIISGDKLESQLTEGMPIREIFSNWLLSRHYKSDHIIHHLNLDYFRN